MIRKIFQWLLRNQKKEIEYKTEEKVKILMFSDYVPRIPEIILYIRRQREIPRRQLLDKTELEKMPGNLVLDLNLWENQLDRFSKIWV